jgi:hypothetical protein
MLTRKVETIKVLCWTIFFIFQYHSLTNLNRDQYLLILHQYTLFMSCIYGLNVIVCIYVV